MIHMILLYVLVLGCSTVQTTNAKTINTSVLQYSKIFTSSSIPTEDRPPLTYAKLHFKRTQEREC